MEKAKGRVYISKDGKLIGTSGAAATNYGPDNTPIEILDQNNNRIGTTTLWEVRKKLGLK